MAPPSWKLGLASYRCQPVKKLIPRNMNHLKSELIMKNLLQEIYNIDYSDVKWMNVKEKDVEPGDVTGNLSESGRVVINIAMNDGEKRTYNWFVKILPKEHKNSELMHKFNIFENEICFYRDIAPDLLTFLNDHGVDDIEFDIPKLLFADNKEEGAIIILDDVSEQGYCQERDANGGRFLSIEKARLAIDAIARIHAASKLYNVHRDVKLEEKHQVLSHNKMWEDTNFLDRLSAMKDSYCEVLKKSSEHDSARLMDRFQRTYDSGPRLKSICAERYNPKQTGAVYLQHGDFHYNNLLFKKADDDEMKVMVVDWQLAYTGRSTGDVSYLLMSSISPEMKQQHGQDLKEAYFNSFNTYLKTFESYVTGSMNQDSPTEDSGSDQSDIEVDVKDLEQDFHDSAPLSLFLSCGNVLSSEADREGATVNFAYNLVKEAAEMKII